MQKSAKPHSFANCRSHASVREAGCEPSVRDASGTDARPPGGSPPGDVGVPGDSAPGMAEAPGGSPPDGGRSSSGLMVRGQSTRLTTSRLLVRLVVLLLAALDREAGQLVAHDVAQRR